MSDDNGFEEALEALNTTVGADEKALRAKLGNDGYARWQAWQNRLSEAQITTVEVTAALTAAQFKYCLANGWLRKACALAVVVAAATGLGWSIWFWS